MMVLEVTWAGFVLGYVAGAACGLFVSWVFE